ncbi:MAG: DMT family transporter [Rhodoferax sp.]|nr:DMT family transporter [Rhodoferax sp.]
MSQRLSPSAIVYLVIPPLLWAGNAVVGCSISTLVSPMTFNLLRWSLAFLLLLPLAHRVLHPGSGLWRQWRRFAVLGLLGTSGYNALNYLALHTSTAINVTLVGASTPVWMLLIGRLFFAQAVSARQLLGAGLSIVGVLLVLSRGEWAVLAQFHLVPGDGYVLIASVGWAVYSWMLTHPTPASAPIRADWTTFLLAQMVFGLLWSTLFTAAEWTLTPAHVDWGWPLLAALAYVALGPSLMAYGAFGAGIQRAGPHVAAHFINLTPLFTALLSAVFLGEPPTVFHALAFVLIVMGIALSRKP